MREKKDKKQRSSLPTQMNLVIRIVAGIYLLYLAYSIYGNVGEAEDVGRVVFPLAMLLFVAIGVVIIVFSLRAMQRGEYVGGARDTGQGTEQKTSPEEGKTEPDRIRFGEQKAAPEEGKTEPDRIRFGEQKTSPEEEKTEPDRIRFGEQKTSLEEKKAEPDRIRFGEREAAPKEDREENAGKE